MTFWKKPGGPLWYARHAAGDEHVAGRVHGGGGVPGVMDGGGNGVMDQIGQIGPNRAK